ncbi:MAG: glycosyltransferase family 39 protein [Isosphaeraceae bacterium]
MGRVWRRPSWSWSWLILAALLLFDVWLRGHAFGPVVKSWAGFEPYLATSPESEPLDCDEAIYGYIGRRLAGGAVMYRDLTENKPPGGYWLYALAVSVGGADETTIRLMPVPFVLATLVLVWRVARRLGGTAAAVLASFTFALVSTDPFLYGESANMEHMINFFAFAALAALVEGWDKPGRSWLVASGVLLGSACLIKQTSGLNLVVFAVALWLRPPPSGSSGSPARSRVMDVLALTLGVAAVSAVAVGVLLAQGAGAQAFEDVFRYGRALATETPPPPNSPPFLMRWVTGNADPEGGLPWPFGRTNYLVWWGTGTWPVWLAGAAGLVWFGLRPGVTATRRLVAAWTLSAWVQVALPGLFWQHYYLLPVPGLAVVFGLLTVEAFRLARSWRWPAVVAFLVLSAALLETTRLQVVEYLRVPPAELVKDRGGPQWLANRALGREIGRRLAGARSPTIFVWGWQGPLYFYSGLDGGDAAGLRGRLPEDLRRAGTPSGHAQVERTMRDLAEHPPAVVFAGYPPFPALRQFLAERYLPSRLSPGLWVRRDVYGVFEAGTAN